MLAQVNEDNRFRFDQAGRVKAIKTAARLGMQSRLSINFMPNAIYRPELCIRSTLEAARAHDFPVERIIFETVEGERISDGKWLTEVFREYQRIGFLTAIDDFGAGFAGLNLLRVWEENGDSAPDGAVRNPDWAARPIFRTAALNRALVIKHRLRRNEFDLFTGRRQVATKVVVPIEGVREKLRVKLVK